MEWLIENKSTGDDEEVIEDVTAKTLSTLIGNVDNLVVLFCKFNCMPTIMCHQNFQTCEICLNLFQTIMESMSP